MADSAQLSPAVLSSAAAPLDGGILARRIERPTVGALEGDLVVSGWVLAESGPVQCVRVRAGDAPLARVAARRSRPDVAAAFPDHPHAGRSGFRVRLPRAVACHADELELEAETGNGEPVPIWRLRLGGASGERLPRVLLEDPFRVTAIISAYNEADVIGSVLDHLAENGVAAYVIDTGSRDGTLEAVAARTGDGVIGSEAMPPRGDGRVSWQAILDRKLELADELGSDWYIHHDADEIRESPWPGLSMRDALRVVDRLGYNAVDFRLLNFPPVDDRFRPGDDVRTHFTRWEDPAEYDRIQRKCWRAGPADVTLEDGGHDVRFADRRLFPLRFLLRHYPIRGQEHGVRKVLRERRDRFSRDEVAYGWHRQYVHVRGPQHVFLRNPAQLRPFDLDRVRLETLLDDGASAVRPADLEAAEGTRVETARGVLDVATASRIAGWALRLGSDEPATVELWDGDRVIERVVADLPRPDLAERGIGDGSTGGFDVRAPELVRDGRDHWIWATVAGTSVALAGSPRVFRAEDVM